MKISAKFLFLYLFMPALPIPGMAQSVITYNRSAWTVTASSVELIADAPNGAAAKLLDGDNSTYWLSEFTNNFAVYPHTLVFDMQVAQPVNQIYYVPRNNQPTAPYSGSVSFGDDGINFGTELPVIFSSDPLQNSINVPAQTHRYFRITVTQNYADHTAGTNGLYITALAEVGAKYNTTLETSLASFIVTAQAGGVKLDWSTNFEVNSANFNIARSADAVNFTTIGTLTASGNTSTTTNYTFTDAAPANGFNFYRLELVNTTAAVQNSFITNAEFPLINYSSSQSKNLNVFYFIPAGKAVWPDFKNRTDSIFLGLQNFYKNEMQRLGRGAKTFGLVTDPTHTKIKLIVINGKNNFDFYSTTSGGGGNAILPEIDAYMAANPSPYYGSHNQIISPAFGYNPATGIVDERVPVYGSGRNCFSLDYPDMKWGLLGTGGVLGAAATLNIGGTAHEMGHGLNLYHNSLKVSEEATLGTALMSNGNETFGTTTTSLTVADATILNHNEVFNADGISYYGTGHATVNSVHACFSAAKNSIIIAGRITNNGSPVTDVAFYHDPNNTALAPGMGANKDYDAPTWTAPIIGTDSFYVEMPITELQVRDSSLYELKILTVQLDGNTTPFFYHYDFHNNLPYLTDPAFTPISATITASAGPNGTISAPGATIVNCSDSTTYTFTPNAGYHVADVLVDGISQGPLSHYTFATAGSAHTISVSFAIGVVPVILADFAATLQNKNDAFLQWITSSEINNSGYDLEMAGTNNVFRKITFVAGYGSTGTAHKYQYTVHDLAPGVYYFRLKIIAQDGTYSYSPVHSVKISGATDISISMYPNPVKDGYVYIDILNADHEKVQVRVINSLGMVNVSGDYTASSAPLKIKMPPAKGEYYLRITVGDRIFVKKIISL